MFTNQKFLGILLVIFIIGGSGYFAYTRFKQDVSQASASPSPSPIALDFTFTKTPAPAVANQTSQAQKQSGPKSLPNSQYKVEPTPQATELPLSKNKKLAHFPGLLKEDVLQNKAAVIQTAKGLIGLKIYPESSGAASNFMILAANGFYDGLIFHRVEDWVIQGGDPEGTGRGGPGYTFPDEPVTRAYTKGIVAMANSGPNTNGSQFFILKTDYQLPPNYTIFGEVVQGMDIVEKITPGDVMQKVTVQNLQ